MKNVSFYCQNCGNETPKWHGKCPACSEWNTIVEEIKRAKANPQTFGISSTQDQPILIQNVKNDCAKKYETIDSELNIVLGGGIVDGSVILLAGEPGIGKSTLMLQMALLGDTKVLYVSGEEAVTQIKLRADRIGIKNLKHIS